jgi:hypothetical protein
VDDQSPCLFYQQPCDTPLLRLPLPVPLEVYCRTHFFRGVTGRGWHLQAPYLVGACKAPRWCPSCQGGLWLGVAPGRRHSGPVRERMRSCNMGRVKTARPLHRTTISNFLAHSLSTQRQTPYCTVCKDSPPSPSSQPASPSRPLLLLPRGPQSYAAATGSGARGSDLPPYKSTSCTNCSLVWHGKRSPHIHAYICSDSPRKWGPSQQQHTHHLVSLHTHSVPVTSLADCLSA